jgi:acetolactate synthase small subunit
MTMQAFHIRYRNTQGTLMRILNAASRRGLDLASVQAEAAERDHRVTLVLDVNSKQVGQLYREWYAVADVTDVRSSASVRDHAHAARAAEWGTTHRPASANVAASSVSAALA